MRRDGVVIVSDSGMDGNYAQLVTTDAKITENDVLLTSRSIRTEATMNKRTATERSPLRRLK